MKSKVLIFSILCIAALSFFVFRSPGIDFEHDGEMTLSLFSQLDPLLGYAHNEKYLPRDKDSELQIHFNDSEYIHYQNGFVGMNYRADDKPLTIVILGSSSSDPYLFNGNWPLKFHRLLKQKNIPHRIFNGAVSGYNSHQLLTKLMRDVFQIPNVNLVISYFGGNDYVENEDVSVDHPSIHPYQIKLFEQLNIYSPADKSFFENLKLAVKKLIGKKASHLQLGQENKNYAKNFAMNIRYMKAACDLNHILYFHFMESTITNEAQRINGTKLSINDPRIEKGIQQFLKTVFLEFKNSSYVFSLQDKIPSDKKIFYDSVHLSSEGNEILSSLIYSKLLRISAISAISSGLR